MLHILEMDDMRRLAQNPPWLRDYRLGDNATALSAALFNDELRWLRRTANFEATDPKDKVFALLGLSRGPIGRNLRIDYSMTAYDLMRKVVLEQVAAKSLDLLSLCFPGRSIACRSWYRI